MVALYLLESTLLRFAVWNCKSGVLLSVNITAILSLYDISFNLLIFILLSIAVSNPFFSNYLSLSYDSYILTNTSFYCYWLIRLAILSVIVFTWQYGQIMRYLTSSGFWFYNVLMSYAQFRHNSWSHFNTTLESLVLWQFRQTIGDDDEWWLFISTCINFLMVFFSLNVFKIIK